MRNSFTRRQLLTAGGVMAGTAAIAALTGCQAANPNWDGSTYLPIGSVVKLKSCTATDVNHMIITRRPKVSATYSISSNGITTKNEVDGVFDYALFIWPIGAYSDLTEGSTMTDVTYANTSDISEVVFLGYEDDIEKNAQNALDTCRVAGTDGTDALNNLLIENLKEKTN